MTDADVLRHRLAGAGGSPAARTAVRIRGFVHILTDTTLGGGLSDHGADTRIDRDTATGRPRWAGTGQAGALRHHTKAVLGAHWAERVFGTGDQDSPVRTTHALAYSVDGGYPAVASRDGNRVDPPTGIVEPGAVFTDEVLTAGAVFPIDWAVVTTADLLVETTAALVRAIDGLSDGSIGLGHRAGKGRGRVTATGWTVTTHDLSTPDGFRSWHSRDRGADVWSPPTETTDLVAQLEDHLPGLGEQVHRLREIDLRKRLVIRLGLDLAETVPVTARRFVVRPSTMVQSGPAADRRVGAGPVARSPLVRPTGIDGTAVPIDSGSAVHSWLKRHTGWILHELATRAVDPDAAHLRADRIHEDLFGTVPRTGQVPSTVRPSRVKVTEAVITGSTRAFLPHVRLNPLTQGVVPHHLFTEEVLVGGASAITVTVNRPHLHDLGAFAWLLRDLKAGVLPPMGAGTTNGHGRRILTDAALDVPEGIRGTADAPFATWAAFSTHPLRSAATAALAAAIEEGPL